MLYTGTFIALNHSASSQISSVKTYTENSSKAGWSFASRRGATWKQVDSKLWDSFEKQPQVAVFAGSVTPYRNDTDRELPVCLVRTYLGTYFIWKKKSYSTLHFAKESNFYLTGCSIASSLFLFLSDLHTGAVCNNNLYNHNFTMLFQKL